MVLREAGLVTDERDGWNMYYTVSTPAICANNRTCTNHALSLSPSQCGETVVSQTNC